MLLLPYMRRVSGLEDCSAGKTERRAVVPLRTDTPSPKSLCVRKIVRPKIPIAEYLSLLMMFGGCFPGTDPPILFPAPATPIVVLKATLPCISSHVIGTPEDQHVA